jgi:hypothetical protein
MRGDGGLLVLEPIVDRAGQLLYGLRLQGGDDIVLLCCEIEASEERGTLSVHQAVTKLAIDQSRADQPLECYL